MAQLTRIAAAALLAAAILATSAPYSRRAEGSAGGFHAGGVSESAPARDEFAGPFPSWGNARSDFGAAGDGAADDTAPLQRALSGLGARGHSPTLFLPSGRYRITATLSLVSSLHVGIVGEDPETTTIVWDGESGGTMLALNGVAYSSVSRLTFEGRRRAAIAVDQSWDNQRPQFDTGNQYADDRFVDVGYGIHGGFKGHGFAETSIVRSRFVRNTSTGVALGNFNALDIWVRDSVFEDCEIGVSNAEGAGNFHVYSSVFRGSRLADLAMGNTGVFSARGNDSRGSRAFFVSLVSKAYPAIIHLQRNTIVDPLGATPIDLKNQGPGLLTDNTILTPPAAKGPAVRWTAVGGADVTSVGNTFTVPKPIETNGRLIAIDDRRVPANTDRPNDPPSVRTPLRVARPIVEVGSGAGAHDIQQAIDRAARTHSAAVVHVPFGTYAIDQTLTIPASDLQIVGDGGQTMLRWTGRGRGPLIRMFGPSAATLRDLQIDGGGSADGVVIEGADASGGRVQLDQVQLRSGKEADLFVDRLDETAVEARDFGHAYSPQAPAIRVVGGPKLASGGNAPARTQILSGAASGNGISYDVSGGARVLVRDLWYESGAAPGFAAVHDRALLSIDGSRLATATDKVPAAITAAGLDGDLVVVASQIQDRVAIVGEAGRARVLALGVFDERETADLFENLAAPPGRAVVVNSRHRIASLRGNPSIGSPDAGAWDRTLMTALLGPIRAEWPKPVVPAVGNAPDVELSRIWIVNGLKNLTISR